MDSREAFIALNMIDGVGPVRVRQLLGHFAEATDILRASRAQLEKVHGIGPEVSSAIAGWEKTVDLKGELKRIEQYGCGIVIQSDENCSSKSTIRPWCSTSRGNWRRKTRTAWPLSGRV
jgi:DNA processing protein